MAQDRVDKRWQDEGLERYSTEAILGTLSHYGRAIDEAGFRALAKDKYPLELAIDWQDAWKGKGQFKLFPTAAFPVLWRRLEQERLSPGELAEALIGTMVALTQRTRDTKVGEGFAQWEAIRARIPTQGEGAEERFTSEVFAHFSEEAWQAFDGMAEHLAQGGYAEDARAFAELEAFLLPERKGVSAALVEAAEGKREAAVTALAGIAQAGGALEKRMSALDALLHLEAKDEVITLGLPLLEDAEKREDYHLGMGLAEKLVELLREKGERRRADEVEARLEKLAEGHHHAHPHHH